MEIQEIKETKKPKEFLLHFDKWYLLEPFEYADIGAIIKALFRYALEGVSADAISFENRFAFAVYKNLKSGYESNQDKYVQRCRKNQENAKKAADSRNLKKYAQNGRRCHFNPEDGIMDIRIIHGNGDADWDRVGYVVGIIQLKMKMKDTQNN